MATDRSNGPRGLEFHVARDSRDYYRFDDWLYSITGNVIFANFRAARLFAQRMNDKRDLLNFPEQAVRASQINALALIHELTHYLFRMYCEQNNPQAVAQSLDWLNEQLGPEAVEASLRKFADEFPAIAVYRRDTDLDTYMNGETDGIPNRQVVLEEMLMLWLENANPAFMPFQELFDDHDLERETTYPAIMSSLYTFFGTGAASEDGSGRRAAGNALGLSENLLDILLAPARAAPHSLEDQLEFIRSRWGISLGKEIYRLLGGLDLIKEEEKPVFFGPGPVELPIEAFAGLEAEPEQFSPDKDWMPSVVMLAKNAYVWLDQLSKDYDIPITTLDQVPDEELDKLKRWGITGLWLIGLWERSNASQRIKQMMGNPDAVASAYSLYDYQIAQRLGGEAACDNLRQRAWKRGIRLASDMVPNHVGIDGRWVIQNPDWFLSVPEPPYPAYTFNGPDLLGDERVGIYLEDHYYERSDAAVVFKRHDRWNGDVRYIYHGNDGTSMPWNDTAQLNYLNPETRESVIQTILHVARQFPIIRFDAAMTLAKKHIERLWFPEPGAGGAIPSRSEYAMTKAEFDAAIPNEFWREVVDRVAQEVPDTLLLAEAFWLMEGYFVRTLGMHRVYNSAFMHLLRDEDNAKYRFLMKQTLEFDPEILKRYVNFQNNPDEKTAVEQFGKGDKYFGICSVMLTLPGLPMIGHGQVEGFAEKYGMEYQRAYWDEQPDQYLIERHEREIFPLMHKRYMFAGVEDFLLYDFIGADGSVIEDVYAYSNRVDDERALVLYHNKFADTQGRIQQSAQFSVKTGNGDERTLVQRSLTEGLALSADEPVFYIFRDYASGLEFLRSGRELSEQGLYVELGAYKCHVFLDWREVQSDAFHQYGQLASFLNGRGVPSVDEALKELFLQPLHYPFKALVNGDMFRRLLEATAADADSPPSVQEKADAATTPTTEADTAVADDAQPPAPPAEPASEAATAAPHQALLEEFDQKMRNLLHEVAQFTSSSGDQTAIAQEVRNELAALLQLPATEREHASADADAPAIDNATWGGLFSWAIVHALGKVTGTDDYAEQSRSWLDEWRLGRIITSVLYELGADEPLAWQALQLMKVQTSYQDWFRSPELLQPARLVKSLLADSDVQQLLRINRYQGTLWFDKTAFERLLSGLLRVALVSHDDGTDTVDTYYEVVAQLQAAATKSGYQVEKLRAIVQG
jgi:glycosidase